MAGGGMPSPAPAVSMASCNVPEARPSTALRLVVSPSVPIRPEHEALTADPDDVVLYRRLDGSAHATVDHVVRHSPTGIDWGRRGSGPADLALSVLHRLADPHCAEALYQRFEVEVVARVPSPGGLIRAADVRAWVAAQAPR